MMEKKKVFEKDELIKMTAEEVIDKLQHENYSLLKTLDSDDLRKEMVKVGKACNTAINYFFRTTGPVQKMTKKSTIKLRDEN